MTFGFIQGNAAFSASNTSQSLTFNSPVTAGSCLVVGIRSSNTSLTGLTDSVNGSTQYSLVRQTLWNSSANNLNVYIFPNTAAGTPTVTATFAAATNVYWAIAEYGGVATSSPVDVSAIQHNDTAVTSLSLPSITTTNANDVLIGIYVTQGSAAQTWTDNVAGSNPVTWTPRLSAAAEDEIYWVDAVVSSAGTYLENSAITTAETYASCQFALMQADVLMPQIWL
ncbi:hypothetical protein [Bradyrhizobium sp. Tv2a-2]|uniref:hypothetical protein n=1 Tax=Bradyrhizobium sp. Tv2a-2 TaxID=113395 RepID=UPI0004653555|nr:hypothetical protein [Bradyrhizobium sp. Tv2a-2]